MNPQVATKSIKLWRAFKDSLNDIWSEKSLSIASFSILTLSLFVIGMIYLAGASSSKVLKDFEDQISVSVYFFSDVGENEILTVKDYLQKDERVQSIRYVSKEQALDNLKASKGKDPLIMKALEEIGENPLWSSIVIKAKNPKDYQALSDDISNSEYKDFISRINYETYKPTIERLTTSIMETRKIGVAVGSIFVAITILIMFNTIRLTLHFHKQEFEVMRLVGASNMYIRMPFIFGGIIYGFAASVIAMLMMFLVARYYSASVRSALFASSSDIISYYYQHFWQLLSMLIVFGCGLGFISSLIAIRRYLKV